MSMSGLSSTESTESHAVGCDVSEIQTSASANSWSVMVRDADAMVLFVDEARKEALDCRRNEPRVGCWGIE